MFNKRKSCIIKSKRAHIKLFSAFILMSLFLLNTFESYAYKDNFSKKPQSEANWNISPFNQQPKKIRIEISAGSQTGFSNGSMNRRKTVEKHDFDLFSLNTRGGGGLIGEANSDDPNTGNGGAIGEGDPDDPNGSGGMIGESDPIPDGIGILLILLLLYTVFAKTKKRFSIWKQ